MPTIKTTFRITVLVSPFFQVAFFIINNHTGKVHQFASEDMDKTLFRYGESDIHETRSSAHFLKLASRRAADGGEGNSDNDEEGGDEALGEVLGIGEWWNCVWQVLDEEIAAGKDAKQRLPDVSDDDDEELLEAMQNGKKAFEVKGRLESAKYGPESLYDTKELLEKDSENRLLARGPRRLC